MKKIFTGMLCAFLLCASSMAQTTHKMQIKMKSGETVEYNTTDVKNITFSEGQPEPQEFTVDFSNYEVTSSSVKVTVVPSNSTRYYANIWIKSYMTNPDGSWLDDKTLIQACIPDPDFDKKCYSGEQTIEKTNLLPGSELVLIVFDAEAKTGAEAKVFKYDMKVSEGQTQEDQFTFSGQEIGFTDVKFHVKAKDPKGFVMARVVKKADFESYGETVMQNLYFGINNSAVDKLIKISEYVKMNGNYGECDFSFDRLLPGTEYTAAAFYVDPENNDPTNVYDWNYTRWDFTTKEATSAPELEVTNVTKTDNADGTVNISLHVKTTNAATIYCAPKEASGVEPYLNEDWEKWSNFFISFKALSQAHVDAANSETGADVTFQNLPKANYYILTRAINSEGGTKTDAQKVQ